VIETDWRQPSSRLVQTRVRAIARAVVLAYLTSCDAAGTADDAVEPIVIQPADVNMLGTSESIAAVEDLEVLDDGTVWVLDSVDPFFVGFGPDGDVLHVHGHSGGGPQEFDAPSGFVTGGVDGEVWVFDRRRHALIEVSRPDSVRHEILLPPDAVPPGSVLGGMNLLSNVVRTARLDDEVILPRRSLAGETDVFGYWLSLWTADLVGLNPETDSVREVIALGTILGDPLAHFELMDGFPPFPLWYRLWAVCDDVIRIYDRVRNEVRAFSRDGVELDAITLPPPRYTEVTPREFARATVAVAIVERMGQVGNTAVSAADTADTIDRIVPRLTAPPQQLANLLPRYVDLRCDEDGTLWLQPFDLEIGGLRGGPLWLRIAPDGETTGVSLPSRFDPYRFTSERIWGVQRDNLDVASIAWIATPL
jgi:hypothetical protein